MKNTCQFPGTPCATPPTKGCFCLPKDKKDLRFPVMLLCDEHGKATITRGARKLSYRPGFMQVEAEEQQQVVEEE